MTETPPTPAPDSTTSGRLSPLGFAVALLLGGGFVGNAWRLYLLGRNAPVAHLVGLPLMAFWIPATVAFAVALVVGTLAMVGKVLPRLSRVPLLVGAVLAFIDIFMLPDVRSPLPNFDVTVPVRSVGQGAEEMVNKGQLPATVEELAPVVAKLGEPFLLVQGVRPERWALVVRTGCTGPIDSAPGVAAGTFLYCVSADRREAWVTAMAVNAPLFGEADVARVGETLVVEHASATGSRTP